MAIIASAQAPDPASFTLDKSGSYTVTTDGWPYAFLPDSGGFYMLVGGMDRAPKAFRYDSTGHKGSPRTGIDLTRRSSDLATWRLENGKIFNVVFGPPDPNGENTATADGEIIWGFVDPLKKDPAEPHVLATLPNADKTAPLGWGSASVFTEGHYAWWIVPHMKKKECQVLSVVSVNWRNGKARVQDVTLPMSIEGLRTYALTCDADGQAILSLGGTDPKTKKDGWAEQVSLLVRMAPEGAAETATVKVPGAHAGCVACRLDEGGSARCVGFAVREDKATPAIIHTTWTGGAITWTVDELDEERTRQLCDHARDPKEMSDPKPSKSDAKERTQALSTALARMRPIELDRTPNGDLLFVGEVQVRNDFLADGSGGTQAGNVRDQILYAVLPQDGAARTGVVRKYLVEEGPPGYGAVVNTTVMTAGDRIYFLFNDWEKHAFASGATPTDKYARINVATLEGAGIFDPMVHVEGPDGPIERTPIQRSSQLDLMMSGCTVPVGPGSLLVALTKGRGIQWMRIDAKR